MFPAHRTENKCVTGENKGRERKNSIVMGGKTQAITDNIPDIVHIGDITRTRTHGCTHARTGRVR